MKKYLGLVLLAMAILVGCNAKGQKSQEGNESTAQETAVQVMTVDDILADAENIVGQEVTVEGVCTHICSHGGKKIFLMGSDDTKSLRVEASEAIGSFKPETVNSLVRVTGVVAEDRIDEAYLIQWETELANSTADAHEEGSCTAEQKANNEKEAASVQERIANMRAKIAERTEKEGKAYISIYHLVGSAYTVE